MGRAKRPSSTVAQEVTMTRLTRFGIASVFVLVALIANGGAALQAQSAADAAAAAKASPALVSALSKELGATPEQAAGAAGSLFGVAKSRLKADEFSQVSKAVPGMDALLKAAPAAGGGGALGGVTGALSSLGGSAGGLSSAMNAFSKLGLKPEMVAKAVPILTSFVSKSGGANVGSLLAGVLK
jgi:hypothetical protein